MSDPFNSRASRRNFLASGAVGAAAFYCTIGKEKVSVTNPGDAAKADAAAARVPRPASLRNSRLRGAVASAKTAKDPVDALTFPSPTPAPGGRYVEYWIQARTVRWNIVPTGRDDWMGVPVPGRNVFTALTYQLMTPGFAAAKGPPSMPGPTLYGQVGDVIVCHFRNNLVDLNQAVTMHPHGVRYTPDYDGAYMGDYTRVGGFIGPGEEFTYRWECLPDSVGVWPYHDHGPNHVLNTFRGLFGALIIRAPGDKVPDVENVVFFHQLAPNITGLDQPFECISGRAYAGNTPTLRAKVGQDVALHCIGMDNDFHDFHLHGHRWQGDGRAFTDNPSLGPNETITARFVEDNPGRFLYHCHVFSHMESGMAGWYIAEP